MPSSKWVLLTALVISAPAYAFDRERDTWLLPEPAEPAPEARKRYDPLEFARIQASANDREPVYAEGKQSELITAAVRNDTKQVEALLKLGVNPNATLDRWGDNALMHAVLHGNTDMTRLLLDAGADPDKPGRGFTPLGMASLRGLPQIVRLLLKAGADINKKSSDTNTPVIAATLMNRMDVIRELLPYRPDLTIWNREGRVSLGIAAQQGNKDIVALLLKAGADPNVRDRNGNRPLQWSGDHHDIAALLVARGGVSF